MDDEPRKNAGASGETPSPAQPGANASPASGGSTANTDPAASPVQPAASTLSKEEQWALFEKELKENDWGHQPC
jgi:hypothetical protein